MKRSIFLLRRDSARREKIFMYFIGLIGLSGVVYTFFGKRLSEYGPDILYVDKETLDVQRSGRYAVLVKKSIDKIRNTSENSVGNRQTLEDLLNKELGDIKMMDNEESTAIVSRMSKTGGTKSDRTNHEYEFVMEKFEVDNALEKYARKPVKAPCKKIFDSDMDALIETSLHIVPEKRKSIYRQVYIEMTKNCNKFISSRGYFKSPFTKIERDFPLAYSIVAYKQIEQVERLLRAIYRPQNHYCIHMDKKSSPEDVKVMKAIASCFPNVYIASRALDVQWGTFSVLEAELVCMSDLWNKTWRYFINLTGQEFPLKTNLEIVKILTAMKGANLVDGTWIRARENYVYRWLKGNGAPPHNIRPIKGSVHIAVNRDFVDFVLHDQRSHDFQKWLNDTEIPDETFFSSLNHNPHLGIPGTFFGEPEEYPRKPTFTRYKNWEIGHGVWVKSCNGKYVRNVCIFGLGDLRKLKDDIGLFANKFYLEYQYLTYECIEELIFNRTIDQYRHELPIDVKYYETLDQVRYQVVKKA